MTYLQPYFREDSRDDNELLARVCRGEIATQEVSASNKSVPGYFKLKVASHFLP